METGWSSLAELTIDATGMILGRLASTAAQRLKDGDTVHIVNAEQAVVSGRPEDVYEKYRGRRERGNRDHGPNFPTAPDRIVKRTIRGMIPDGPDGRDMLSHLKTYRGNPEGREADEVDVKTVSDLAGQNAVSIEKVSQNI